ncbi:unnamed protein product, partial [Heterosigma akashiwo]
MYTRGFGGIIPGPLIRMKACGTYRLTVFNTLGSPDYISGEMNTFSHPNSTNLHVHGLHISSESGYDDILGVTIGPGESHNYTYPIVCDHMGGLFFYHTHHHGSVALQTGGGAFGPLVIEENTPVPAWLSTMDTHYIVMHETWVGELDDDFEILNLLQVARESNDEVMSRSTPGKEPFILVNGEISPTFRGFRAEIWNRVQLLWSGGVPGLNYVLKFEAKKTTAGCEYILLGKDGVYLTNVPRYLARYNNRVFVTPSSRLDIAFRCAMKGPIIVTAYAASDLEATSANDYIYSGGSVQVATLKVGGNNPLEEDIGEYSWTPCRPSYLYDLLGETAEYSSSVIITGEGFGDAEFNLATSQDFDLVNRGGQDVCLTRFGGDIDDFLYSYDVDSVVEWRVSGSGSGPDFANAAGHVHPVHLHVYHMQFQSDSSIRVMNGYATAWNHKGDFVDTVSSDGTATMRFRTERFGGRIPMHCHVLEHSDLGSFALIRVSGGQG